MSLIHTRPAFTRPITYKVGDRVEIETNRMNKWFVRGTIIEVRVIDKNETEFFVKIEEGNSGFDHVGGVDVVSQVNGYTNGWHKI